MSSWIHSVLADAAGISGRETIPRVVTVANPAAGADFTVNVQSGTVWFVQSATALLTTSAVAANRFPTLRLGDGSSTFFFLPPPAAIIGSTVARFGWISGLGSAYSVATGALNAVGYPSIPLLGGWTFSVVTTAIDATDQWTSIVLNVLEVEETPMDVEISRDLAVLAGSRLDAIPQTKQ